MNTKVSGLALGALLFAMCVSAQAQQARKIPRIGYLTLSSGLGSNEENFRQGLRELGYVEGQNITIEWRFAHGKTDAVPALAGDLVRLKVDAIVTAGGTVNVQAAKNATTTIPIVFTNSNDPIAAGFVASLAHPGGNITGTANLTPELSGKHVELLKEIIPKATRIAVLANKAATGRGSNMKEVEIAARSAGIQLQVLAVAGPDEFESAFEDAKKKRADALIVLPSPFLGANRKQIVDHAAKIRIPAIYPNADWVTAGGLVSYGPKFSEMYRRAAFYVDKILKGTKPTDLPVEQPMKFEFIINLKAAKQIGLTIPPNMLARADRVIK
jgi:putative ABC transport system substrate-binding protein